MPKNNQNDFCITLGSCTEYYTPNDVRAKVQNSDFHNLWPSVPEGTSRFTVSIRGKNDLYIALFQNEEVPDDEEGDTGTPKIGMKYESNMNYFLDYHELSCKESVAERLRHWTGNRKVPVSKSPRFA